MRQEPHDPDPGQPKKNSTSSNGRNGNDLKNKTVLLVNPGSVKKRFILQRIKALGLQTVVLNKKEETWAKPYVNHWIIADNTNHSEAVSAIKVFNDTHPDIKIDGAITFWEDDVLLTSRIIERFHFTGIPIGIAKKARNKFLFRDFCKKNGLPFPKHTHIYSENDIEKALKTMEFPMVMKPVFGSSSAYVIKIENEEELRSTFDYMKKSISTNVESALTDGTDILIEEYIDGDEVDIDILIQNGRIKFAVISDNTKTREPFFIEADRITPSQLPENDQRELIEMADMILEKMGVQNGCIHLEAKSTKNGPVPIEVNLRMGGDEIYFSVREAWRVDLIEMALKIAFGTYIPKIKTGTEPKKYLITRTFVPDYSGIFVKIDVDKKLEDSDFVEENQFFKKVGDSILVPPDGYEYFGWLMVSGDNFLDAQNNLEQAVKYIKYEIARFHHSSSIGKTVRKTNTSFSTLNGHPYIREKARIEKIRQMSISQQRNLHIGIACNGYHMSNQEAAVENELSAVGQNIQSTLKDLGYRTTFIDFNNVQKAINDLHKSDIDLVFNVCERINDSSLLEPHAASIFDVLQIPYTGSSPFTLGLCIDKIRVKKLLTYHNIPTPKWDYIYNLDDNIRNDLKYPLIVKPANTDNSIGITNDSVVTNKNDLRKQLEKLTENGRAVLIEEYVEGDEYDVSVMGSDDDLKVLPLSRSIFDKMPEGYWHIYPFEAKWGSDSVYKKTIVIQRPPKNVNKKLISLLSEIAMDTYNILGCHDYGRVELRVDKSNNPFVLELNPNPSINKGDCLPSVAKLVGMDYGDFIEEIIRLCIKRYKNNPPYYHLQSSVI